MEKQKGYTGICPVCGKKMWICKSVAMKNGINAGNATCPYCKSYLYVKFNEQRQEMNLGRFKDYQERHCKEGQENVKTDDKGGRI